MQSLGQSHQSVRHAIRQLIAMTQGIINTSRPDSAIAEGTSIDHFTKADLVAIGHMSGCFRG
jgi:hypothetical protein